jgi:hypothetical protein
MPIATAPQDLRPTAPDIRRGTLRLLADMDFAGVPEVTLATGRRADLLAIGPDGSILIVEIKTCRADFLSDGKWREYRAFADAFYFAVAPGFPIDLLPADEGLILADRWHGEVVREAPRRPIAPARRRAVTLRVARLAATRLAMTDEIMANPLGAAVPPAPHSA